WKHCLAVACIARRVAQVRLGADAAEEAFVYGLLHDLGKVALQTAMPKTFARIVRRTDEARANIADVERAILGIDHSVVGHRLAERWGLPGRLTECIWLHHQLPEALPPSVAGGGHVQVVQLADTIAREQRFGYSGNHRLFTTSRDLAARIGLAEADRVTISESVGEEIEQRAEWIGAEEINAREVYLRALMQTTEELTTANAGLSEHNRRLRREEDYFLSMRSLNQSVSPRASVREACAAGASALRRALSLPAVVVFTTSPDGRWIETGYDDGTTEGTIEERRSDAPDETDDAAAAVEMARAGMWIAPPGPAFLPVVDRYRGRLGDGTTWLLPIVREQRWIAGALFCLPATSVANLRRESGEIEALGAAVGLAISQARVRSAAVSLGDELAEVNRRLIAMQGELLQARTLETVVAMASGAAHELNNPLAVISGRAQALRQQIEDAHVREALETISQQAQACSDIVTDLMDFAQSPPPRPETVDLHICLDRLRAELASSGLLEARACTIEIASDTPCVWFDSEHLTACMRELFDNAIEATDAETRGLTVKVCAHPTEESVVISVSDNGRGMTDEVRNRALDPFFSVRPAGRARGLGLARVHRWMRQGGGQIRIESEPGRGTRVELRIPIARS
ncbi:MAG: HDOD domain-containing protein, partial [Phycisphaerae bacterium]